MIRGIYIATSFFYLPTDTRPTFHTHRWVHLSSTRNVKTAKPPCLQCQYCKFSNVGWEIAAVAHATQPTAWFSCCQTTKNTGGKKRNRMWIINRMLFEYGHTG